MTLNTPSEDDDEENEYFEEILEHDVVAHTNNATNSDEAEVFLDESINIDPVINDDVDDDSTVSDDDSLIDPAAFIINDNVAGGAVISDIDDFDSSDLSDHNDISTDSPTPGDAPSATDSDLSYDDTSFTVTSHADIPSTLDSSLDDSSSTPPTHKPTSLPTDNPTDVLTLSPAQRSENDNASPTDTAEQRSDSVVAPSSPNVNLEDTASPTPAPTLR